MAVQWIAVCVNTNPYWLPQTKSTENWGKSLSGAIIIIGANTRRGGNRHHHEPPEKQQLKLSDWAFGKLTLCGICTAKTNLSGGLLWHGNEHHCPMLYRTSLSNRFFLHGIGQLPCQRNSVRWDWTMVSDAMSDPMFEGFVWHGIGQAVWSHFGQHLSDE